MNERILEILRQLETEFPGHPVYQINVGGNTWTIKRETEGPPIREALYSIQLSLAHGNVENAKDLVASAINSLEETQ